MPAHAPTVAVISLLVCSALLDPASAHPGLPRDIAQASESLARAPDRIELWVERARLYRLENNGAASLADARQALGLNPTFGPALLQEALALSQLRRDSEAEQSLTALLLRDPRNESALIERGDVRRRLGRMDEAVADYSAVLSRHDVLDVYLRRGAVQETLGQLDEAAAGYLRGLGQLHGAVSLRLALIRVETNRGRDDRAIRLIDEVLAQAPVKTKWLLRRADIHAGANRKSAAESDRRLALAEAERAAVRKPSALNRCLRAEAFLSLGMHTEAIEDIRHAAAASPRSEVVRRLVRRMGAVPGVGLDDRPASPVSRGKDGSHAP